MHKSFVVLFQFWCNDGYLAQEASQLQSVGLEVGVHADVAPVQLRLGRRHKLGTCVCEQLLMQAVTPLHHPVHLISMPVSANTPVSGGY